MDALTMETNYIQSIGNLELSQSTVKGLKAKGVFSLEDLTALTVTHLAEFFNFEVREEIIRVLRNQGLCLKLVHQKLSFDEFLERFDTNERLLSTSEEMGFDKAVEAYKTVGLFKKINSLKLSERSQNVLKLEGVIYLGDLTIQKEDHLSKLANLGKTSVNKIILKLYDLGLELGMKLQFWPIQEAPKIAEEYTAELAFLDTSTLKDVFFNSIASITTARDSQVLEMRLGIYEKRHTLEELGTRFDVTRERIRQIQKKTMLEIINGEFWCKVLTLRIERIMNKRSRPLFLDSLADEDSWFDGFKGRYSLLETILKNFVPTLDIQFLAHGKRKIVTTLSNEEWLSLRYNLLSELEYNLDVNYTSDDIDLIVESRLADLGYPELSGLLVDILTEDLHFVVSEGERILTSVGNSSSSRLKVLLEQAEEPLHYTKLTELYQKYYGVSVDSRYIHNCLGANNFCLFDRGTYGLEKHLSIPLEGQAELRKKMETYILEGKPNRQWHAKNLVEEFNSNTFGGNLDIYAVNILLSSCERLSYLGRNAWKVKTEGAERDERVEIHTVVYKVLKEAGGPLSSQELQERVARERGIGSFFNVRATDLYSRVDEARWGLLTRDFMMTFEEQKKIKDFFYTYFMEVKIAAYKDALVNIFYSSTPENIANNHIFGVLVSDSRFKAWHGGYVGLSSWTKSGRMSLKKAVQSMFEQAQEAMSTASIISTLKQQLGKDFTQGSVTVLLTKSGFEYNRVTGLWENSHVNAIYDKSTD